ncbi:MAG: alpha/beta fold hydrolase [Anaerolineales bacterium]
MKYFLEYKHGSTLAYAYYGDPDGPVLLVQHGMIASILDSHWFDRLIQAGKRVICPARPGYGRSTPYQMANIAEWGQIIATLVEHLGLSEFDVLGLSSGAPYSYAIGYQIPDKVRCIYIFSGTPALYDQEVQAHWPYPLTQGASIAEMQQVARQVFFADISETDRLRADIQDSMANDCFGIAQDLRLRCMDWGFTLSEVKPQVCMQHSQADAQVPFITAQLTAKRIPNCQLSIRTGEHFSQETLDRFFKDILLTPNS